MSPLSKPQLRAFFIDLCIIMFDDFSGHDIEVNKMEADPKGPSLTIVDKSDDLLKQPHKNQLIKSWGNLNYKYHVQITVSRKNK